MRELKLTYLEKVQQETTRYLNTHIKHDFLRPDRELTLDLSVKEAELLLSAGEGVRGLADSGELKKIHERFNAAKNRVDTEYLAIREHLAKSLQIVEGKEDAIYAQLNSLGFANVRLHTEAAPIFDTLGLTSGDTAFENLATVEAAIEQGHEAAGKLTLFAAQLHAYIGVKAKIFEIDAKLKQEHVQYVVKDANDATFQKDEWRQLDAARQSYQENFSRFELSDSVKAEYDAFVGPLTELHQTLG